LPNIAARNQFSTRDLHEPAMEALGVASDNYSLASLRYDLSKLRAKGLLYKVPRTRRYKLTRQGYSICVVFLKLFERIYAPLTTGLLQSVAGDSKLQRQRRTQLDGLYQRVADDLDELLSFVGLKVAA
jgi:hypothetical protein